MVSSDGDIHDLLKSFNSSLDVADERGESTVVATSTPKSVGLLVVLASETGEGEGVDDEGVEGSGAVGGG